MFQFETPEVLNGYLIFPEQVMKASINSADSQILGFTHFLENPRIFPMGYCTSSLYRYHTCVGWGDDAHSEYYCESRWRQIIIF
jgi:hypothetical protein